MFATHHTLRLAQWNTPRPLGAPEKVLLQDTGSASIKQFLPAKSTGEKGEERNPDSALTHNRSLCDKLTSEHGVTLRNGLDTTESKSLS